MNRCENEISYVPYPPKTLTAEWQYESMSWDGNYWIYMGKKYRSLRALRSTKKWKEEHYTVSQLVDDMTRMEDKRLVASVYEEE